ncbi:MAG TPA: peptidoglycan DD-metalloendopeptidase family protein [Anaerolineales bacterium]|nr:peptidoglycan DD-metalloendopeptidase family protein [Anaerolineales bacterium]
MPATGGIGSGGELLVVSPSAESLPPTVVPPPAEEPTPTPTPPGPEPIVSPTFPPTPTQGVQSSSENILYRAQPGDVLRSVAVRFGVVPADILLPDGNRPADNALLSSGQNLFIPRRLGPTGPAEQLLPDSELVYSPHAIDFDISGFVESQDGFLSQYQEIVAKRSRSGAEVVALAARDHSVNPRVLLALLEYHSGWISQPARPLGNALNFPLGHLAPETQGLYRQLTWLANELGTGYYGWRAGTLTELLFPDSSLVRLSPELNAGTVALQYYFSLRTSGRSWAEAVSMTGFIETYWRLFGDPFDYAHPLYEVGIQQPELILPFLKGRIWAFTGGPHGAWERESAWAALDFAPSSLEPGCTDSEDWVLAAAAGLVVRSGSGVVVLDLDADGEEQTGWNLLYLHIGADALVQEGQLVEQGDLIGHPSCEGGVATGTHVHLARKYNGEWILADGPLPFTLSGWVVQAGSKPYQGALIKGDQVVIACTCASQETNISR